MSFTDFRNIGIACELQNGRDHVPTEILKELIADFNASLHIINWSESESQKSKIIREASVLMDALAPLNHEFHFINSGNDDKRIMDFAEKEGVRRSCCSSKKTFTFR